MPEVNQGWNATSTGVSVTKMVAKFMEFVEKYDKKTKSDYEEATT